VREACRVGDIDNEPRGRVAAESAVNTVEAEVEHVTADVVMLTMPLTATTVSARCSVSASNVPVPHQTESLRPSALAVLSVPDK
jgi:hypothetical protein